MTEKTEESPANDPGLNITELADLLGVTRPTAKAFVKNLAPCGKGVQGETLWRKSFVLAHWAEKKRAGEQKSDSKKRIDDEKWRKLKLANDEHEGLLVGKSWVAGQMSSTGARIKSIEADLLKTEPDKFAAAAGDTAACREILRNSFTQLTTEIAKLGEIFLIKNQ